MERRRFLTWGASGTMAAWLAACGGGGEGPAPAPAPAPAPGPAPGPGDAEWRALAAGLQGRLLRPADAD